MRAFLDSSTLIYGFEFPASNSAAIYDAALERRFEACINEKVVEEVRRYLRGRRGRHLAYLATAQLERHLEVKRLDEVAEAMRALRGTVKEKDLAHLATVRHFRIPRLVAYDEDFDSFPEYRTPRDFAKELGFRPRPSDF